MILDSGMKHERLLSLHRIGESIGWMGIHNPNCTTDSIIQDPPYAASAYHPSDNKVLSPLTTRSLLFDSTGSLNFSSVTTDATPLPNLHLTGYPDTWPQGSCATEQCTALTQLCTDPLLLHNCATSPGQSGSPMWKMDSLSSSIASWGAYIYAVHNAE
jgi:hypothetical protein